MTRFSPERLEKIGTRYSEVKPFFNKVKQLPPKSWLFYLLYVALRINHEVLINELIDEEFAFNGHIKSFILTIFYGYINLSTYKLRSLQGYPTYSSLQTSTAENFVDLTIMEEEENLNQSLNSSRPFSYENIINVYIPNNGEPPHVIHSMQKQRSGFYLASRSSSKKIIATDIAPLYSSLVDDSCETTTLIRAKDSFIAKNLFLFSIAITKNKSLRRLCLDDFLFQQKKDFIHLLKCVAFRTKLADKQVRLAHFGLSGMTQLKETSFFTNLIAFIQNSQLYTLQLNNIQFSSSQIKILLDTVMKSTLIILEINGVVRHPIPQASPLKKLSTLIIFKEKGSHIAFQEYSAWKMSLSHSGLAEGISQELLEIANHGLGFKSDKIFMQQTPKATSTVINLAPNQNAVTPTLLSLLSFYAVFLRIYIRLLMRNQNKNLPSFLALSQQTFNFIEKNYSRNIFHWFCHFIINEIGLAFFPNEKILKDNYFFHLKAVLAVEPRDPVFENLSRLIQHASAEMPKIFDFFHKHYHYLNLIITKNILQQPLIEIPYYPASFQQKINPDVKINYLDIAIIIIKQSLFCSNGTSIRMDEIFRIYATEFSRQNSILFFYPLIQASLSHPSGPASLVKLSQQTDLKQILLFFNQYQKKLPTMLNPNGVKLSTSKGSGLTN